MKKVLFIFTLLLSISLQIIAGERTEQQMKDAAAKVLRGRNVTRAANSREIKEFYALSKLKIYGYADGGFAVVTSDDRFESVIGVSSSQFTETIPCGFKWWLETANNNMQKEIVSNSTKGKTRASQNASVAPMITTTWGQGRPYNDNCKFTHGDDTYQCVTGCVATALAQIMNYYRYPTTGTGSCSYDITYNNEYTITYSEDFSQSIYDWDNMLDSYSTYHNTTIVDAHTQAVAKLMKDCGVASKMQYNVLESSANFNDAKSALINNFSYSSSTKYYDRNDYGKDDWLNIIYNELDNDRPILYGGAWDDNGTNGHAFVLNGYDSSGNIYINWGWEGNFDGYYNIDMLNPDTYEFNNAQGMITIIPAFGVHTLSISANGLGNVNYGIADGIMIRDKAKDFIVKDDKSVTLFFTPDSERELKSLTVNDIDVTSNIINNQYTISNINADISVVVSFESSTNADDVVVNSTNFPDEAFQNWILNNIEAARDGVLTATELESITYIDCSKKQIHSLKGIEYFNSLDNLCCQFNQLTSLDVSKNTKLNSLICYQNQLTTLNLGDITTLVYLACGENKLTSLDVSKNTSITSIQCQDNQLTLLNLGNISTLTDLNCSRNRLTSLDVSRNVSLQYLDCGGNQLVSIDVSKNTALQILNCANNQLSSLDVSHNKVLSVLYAGENQLSALDVSNNKLLTQLCIDFNKLTSIDVSNNVALEVLTCWANQLTSFDVSNNTALTRLHCMVNYLTGLDLSKNTALTDLRCELNQLYDLDLSNNPLLTNYTEKSPQYADLTYDYINGLNVTYHYVSIKALDIPEGIAIPVPSTFDTSKVSDLMLDGTAVQGNVVNKNGLKFLVFADSGIDPNCQMLTYSYDTGNGTVGLMAVNVPITYTGTATIWTDPDTNHTWIYSTSDANASIDRNAWVTGDIVVPSAINGYTVNNIDYKAFYGCNNMTSLIIPSTVTHMCDYVVNGCHKLKKLIVMATTPPAISDVTFMDYDIPLYVPDDAVDIYNNTPIWKNFKNIRALSTVNQHNLIYIVDGETYKTYILNEGDNITPETEPTKETYTFSGWSEIPETMPANDVIVTGSFGIEINETHFPDENFRNYLATQTYGEDGVITVEEFAAITSLNVKGKQITNLKGIEYFTALTELDCANNQLTSLDLSKNTALTEIDFSDNLLTSIDLSKNTALASLRCNENLLTILDLSANTALTELICFTNQLVSLNVSKNNMLAVLLCFANKLTTLDVSDNTALEELHCNHNQLTSLDVSNNTALIKLSCYNNQLTSLDVSKNIALTVLLCGVNQLTSLDVSKNTALTELCCDNNQLTSLDVSNNTFLDTFYCEFNQLTSLELSNNTELVRFICNSNLLTSLDVSKNTSLGLINCYSNQLKGEAMDAFVESLPSVNNKLLKIIYNNNEGNVMTTAQVAAAKVKGWTPQYYDGSKWLEYAGSIPKFKLTYMLDGVEYKSLEVEYGATITPEANPEKDTYLFSGWSEIPETMPANDLTITGTFERYFTVGNVVRSVNFIMNENATSEEVVLYDLNSDGDLNIGDVILVVKWILNNGSESHAAARTRANDMVDLSQYVAVQFDVRTTSDTNLRGIRLVKSMEQTHQMMYLQKDANTYSVVVYSLSNKLMKPENGCVVEIDTDNDTQSGLHIENVIVALPTGETQSYNSMQMTTNIQQIESDGGPTVVYDLNGKRLNGNIGLKKGVYIVNGKKVIVK